MMKRIIFMFSFLVGTIGLLAHEVVPEQECGEELIEIEIPININAPSECYYLLSVITANEPLELLGTLADALNSTIGIVLPEVICLDIYTPKCGLVTCAITITTNGDPSLWEITISDVAFNCILNDEGATGKAEWIVVPGLLKVTFVISAY